MSRGRTVFVHYSAPPTVGGVEAVMDAHARVFLDSGCPVTIVAGSGELSALPDGAQLNLIAEMDTQHPEILKISAALEQGSVPASFAPMRDRLVQLLRPLLEPASTVIVHNVFTKHFNLPLTAALFQLLEEGAIHNCIAWCHDLTWTSPNSRDKVFPGYPWDLLRTYHPRVHYVAVSEQRQKEVAELMQRPESEIEVIYNGVDPCVWFGLTPEGESLVNQLDLLSGDLILLMPVRITQAKNIELAARVLAALRERSCRSRLVVTGPPDPHSETSMQYYHSLLDLRRELGLEQEMRFVYGSRPDVDDPYLVSRQVVADLLRVSDLVFMPSHREGFGMPVLEAGLIGLPVVASVNVPAAREIGGRNVYLFNPKEPPAEIARLILEEAVGSRAYGFRKKMRQNFTWAKIFEQRIAPLLREPAG